MAQTPLFEHAVAQSYEWLHELNARLQSRDDRSTVAALRAVLSLLRDRLSVDEAANLAAQLPTLVRGLYYENYHPASTPMKLRHMDEFLVALGERLKAHPDVQPEAAARAVFALLEEHVSAGEIDDVVSCLPQELRPLWPAKAVARVMANYGDDKPAA